MTLKEIFIAASMAKNSGGAVNPEQIDQAVNDYLEANPVGEDVWEDVCDITTEEDATVIIQDFGAKYKKLKVLFLWAFASSTSCNVHMYPNVDTNPGNADRCYIWQYPYGNMTTASCYFEFSADRDEILSHASGGGVFLSHGWNLGSNYPYSNQKNWLSRAFTQPMNVGENPVQNGVFKLMIKNSSNVAFTAGSRLVVKGVRA